MDCRGFILITYRHRGTVDSDSRAVQGTFYCCIAATACERHSRGTREALARVREAVVTKPFGKGQALLKTDVADDWFHRLRAGTSYTSLNYDRPLLNHKVQV